MGTENRGHRVARIAIVCVAAIALAPLYFWPLLPVLVVAIPLLILLLPPLLAAGGDDEDELRVKEDTWVPRPLPRPSRRDNWLTAEERERLGAPPGAPVREPRPRPMGDKRPSAH